MQWIQGSRFEYLIREKLNVSKEQLATLDDDMVKDNLIDNAMKASEQGSPVPV